MKWHRGLGLVLVVFGALYIGLAPWLSTGHGPIKTPFEAVRRYDTALRLGRMSLAAGQGETALALARTDERWNAEEIATLEASLAETELAAGHRARALQLARSASVRLGTAPSGGGAASDLTGRSAPGGGAASQLTGRSAPGGGAASQLTGRSAPGGRDLALVIDVARTHARVALAERDGLEAACTMGILLEGLGPDRVAHPDAGARAHPELTYLAATLHELGQSLRVSAAAIPPNAASMPLTSCAVLADFYLDRKDYVGAATVSDIIVAAARSDEKLPRELHAALLQQGARIHELRGEVAIAQTRLEDAVKVLDQSPDGQAHLYALESLGTFLSNWGESGRALPVLEQALALREAQSEPNLPRLAPALIALGYAQFDSEDAASAEASFKRAYDVARSQDGTNPPAWLEAALALQQLYDAQGRAADAAKFKQEADALEKSGVGFADEVPAANNVMRISEPASRAIVIAVPFWAVGEPASGRAADAFSVPGAASAHGSSDVIIAAPQSAPWAALWPASQFERTGSIYPRQRVLPPAITASDPLRQARLLYIPAQATRFSAGAERAARLQATLGPGIPVALAHWASEPAPRGLLRDPAADGYAKAAIAGALGALGADQTAAPLYVVAEGRAARLLLNGVTTSANAAQLQRLKALFLIAPDLTAAEMKTLATRLAPGGTAISVYAARGGRALLVSQGVYREAPIGLSAAPIAGLSGVEWIEIGLGEHWASSDRLASGALFADIANALREGRPATQRCGLARVSEARDGDAFVLNPSGCAAKTVYAN